MLHVTNYGASLLATNYYGSEWVQEGALLLSWNAGAARLLIPPAILPACLAEIRGAELVVVSRGLFRDHDCYELMFEDGSDTPYSIQISCEQTDFLIPARRESFVLIVHSPDGAELVFPARYRQVAALPCRAPWKGPRGTGWTRNDKWGLVHTATNMLWQAAAIDDAPLVRALLLVGADPNKPTTKGVARWVATGEAARAIEEHLAAITASSLVRNICQATTPTQQRRRL